MIFTYEHAWSTLIYYTAFSLFFITVFGSIHSAVMAHRDRNAKNEQREIDAELAELKYQQETYWSNKFKDYNSFGMKCYI